MTDDRVTLLTRMFALTLESFCKGAGLPPGTLTVTPDKDSHRVAIEIIVPDGMPLGGDHD